MITTVEIKWTEFRFSLSLLEAVLSEGEKKQKERRREERWRDGERMREECNQIFDSIHSTLFILFLSLYFSLSFSFSLQLSIQLESCTKGIRSQRRNKLGGKIVSFQNDLNSFLSITAFFSLTPSISFSFSDSSIFLFLFLLKERRKEKMVRNKWEFIQ